MPTPTLIIGSYLSPYVRKVLALMHLKGIPYEIDPIVPFYGNDGYGKMSPLRRIPVLRDDLVTLCDSSVICQYLEDRYPSPSLYPADIAQRAQARWWEEYADTHMGNVIIWQLFNQLVIGPFVWGRPTDKDILDKTLNEDLPAIMDHLEAALPPEGWLFGDLSIADISLAAFFKNAAFARWQPDPDRWPITSSFVIRTLELEAFTHLQEFELLMTRTPIAQHREALSDKGAPISKESFGTSTPRRGPLTQ